MNKNLVITAIIGTLTIILGAFGAHSLENSISLEQLKSFETGVRYQMFHVLALLFVNMFNAFSSKTKNTISVLFFIGILFFSGSIYAITFGVNAKTIWFITPIGGLLFILGWLKMALSFNKKM